MSNNFIDKLFHISPEVEVSKRKPLKALIIVILIGIIWCVIFSVFFLALGSWLGYLVFLYIIVGALLIRILKTKGKGALVIGVFSIQLMSFLLLSIFYFGWDFGFHYPLIVTFLFIFLPHYNNLIYPILLGLTNLTTIFLGYFYVQHLNSDGIIYSNEIMEVMHFANITVTCLGIAMISKLFERDTRLSELRVIKEKLKSDNLLHNILPVSIAKELKEKGKTEPKFHPNVTILFTDFKGFTKLVASISAIKLMEELNDIFGKFDDIVEEEGLEKIETIGDAYLAACGLPEASPDHAIKCVTAAQRMLHFLNIRNATHEIQWDMRIGIHSGPIVAGVVGKKKFGYDLFGDSINTASRMESNGEINRINISDSTYQLVKKNIECKHRGKINAKGKGEMDMYFVN